MRRFLLNREVDHSGLSGTGTVAEGVEFVDGVVVIRWLAVAGIESTTVMHRNIGNVIALHGHHGSTRVEWIDG